MKKLINAVDRVVIEQLEGMALAHPELRVHISPHYIVRADSPVRGKVALVSGGGSGHEPMHGGFVGQGMLDGACPGEVFTSPTPNQMYECAKAVNGGAGVLFIVKNYTGDVLNFEIAAEMAGADDIPVQTILIDDDVAVKDSLYTAGRRGVGLTVLAEKIVGAAAGRLHPGAVRQPVPQGEPERPVDGDGPHIMHSSSRRQAHLYVGGKRNRARHRHPWRAGHRASPAPACGRDRGDHGFPHSGGRLLYP